MTYYPICGAWTSAARIRERCNACIGPACKCCGGNGVHLGPNANQQRDNINQDFAQTTKNALFVKRAV